VAARLGVFGLRGLVARLDDHLSLPTLGHRTALPRHQGLRATLDWSHGLLTADEQRVLRRLAVFRERFSLEAVAAVAIDAGADTSAATSAATQAVMNLVAKSLLSAEPGDDMVQYRLLQTTRSYAAERLAASGEQAEIERRHALHCHALLAVVMHDSETQIPARWRERHGRRLDDLRAALAWSLGDGGDAELGAALLAHSASLWFGLAMVNEYLQRLEQAITGLPPSLIDGPLDRQLHLVLGQASLATRGAAPEGQRALERAVALARRQHDADTQLRGLWSLFSLHSLRGDYPAARAAAEQHGQVATEAGDAAARFTFHRIMALCLHNLGEQAQALQHVQQALAPGAVELQPAQGTLFHLDHRTAALTQLARIRWLQGAPDEALRAADDAVDAARAADHPQSLTYALSYAACPVALWCGDDALAEQRVAELGACVEAHSLLFWQSWPPLFRRALAARRGDAAACVLDEATLHFSHIDMLATLHPAFVGPAVQQRVAQGANRWCAPEVQRVLAQRALQADGAERADGADGADGAERGPALQALQATLAAAQAQGAHGWALRCAYSLAEALLADGMSGPARELLLTALAPIQGGGSSGDVRRAQRLIERLAAGAGAAAPAAGTGPVSA